MEGLINLQFPAANTNTSQNILNGRQELNVKDGATQTEMAEVSGATMVGLGTRQTLLAVVQNAHAGIKEPPYLRLGSLISGLTGDLYNRAIFNLLLTKDAKLDTDHRFDVLLPFTMKSF
jgi:hypothetical protein